MKWHKKGFIHVPDGRFDWGTTHAQLPIVDILDTDRWRIYFATRNARNQSPAFLPARPLPLRSGVMEPHIHEMV